MEYVSVESGNQVSERVAAALAARLEAYLEPLLRWLDECLDKRLVVTFLAAIEVILQFRHQACGLLLSELGGYLLGPAQAPAGTKRLSNLLRSPKWSCELIERFLWDEAEQHLGELDASDETALALWDESVWEKPESLAIEGLCAVRSSQAARLKRIKPGFYNPPSRPIFVPGMNWLGVLLIGMKSAPKLAALRWWTSRGKFASDRRSEEKTLLRELCQSWGRRVLHVFDRGFAGEPWLKELSKQQVRFVMRWPKGYKLSDAQGRSDKPGLLTRGKRSQDHRLIWDARRRCFRKTGLLMMPVFHPPYPDPLWLVVSRPGKGRAPWYLLTNEPLDSLEAAWQIVFAYARRWQIEQAWRFSKSELAFENPRLWSWQNRLKLLFIATLAFAFLLTLLRADPDDLCTWLLRHWCHRTGKRCREASAPLYRLRSALSRLWLAYEPPSPSFAWRNSG